MKIIIGADLVPTKENIDSFIDGTAVNLIGEPMKDILDSADYIMMNLEAPLTDCEMSIVKCGPCLGAPKDCITGIKAINPYFFTLANNHICDYGAQGIYDTIDTLDKAGIAHAGAGMNINEASKPHFFENAGIKVGVFCCAEHEFSIATDEYAGANPYDPLTSFDMVEEMKAQCDFVIVLYHGGKEYYRYPSPHLQRVFRKFADKGADIVVAQHTHCIGCKEEYNDSSLVYGQGNFLFSKYDNEYWNSALLIEADLQKGEKPKIKYIPICKYKNGICIPSIERGEVIENDFQERSKEIESASILNSNYEQYCLDKLPQYLNCFAGNNLIRKVIRKIFGEKAFYRLMRRREYLRCLNYVHCEAHLEIMDVGLNTLLKEDLAKGRYSKGRKG